MGILDPGPELLMVIALILLLLFNPKQMAAIMHQLGRLVTQYHHLKKEINKEVTNLRREAEAEVQSATADLDEMVGEIEKDSREMTDSLTSATQEVTRSMEESGGSGEDDGPRVRAEGPAPLEPVEAPGTDDTEADKAPDQDGSEEPHQDHAKAADMLGGKRKT